MREIIKESQPFVARRALRRPGPRDLRRPPLQARDHRRRQHGPDVGDVVHGVGPHLREPAARAQGRASLRGLPGLHRPVPWPARRRHQPPPRPLQAHAGRRRVLARRREEPAAPTHLRHGVGLQEGPRRAPRTARGGRQARPPQARRRARPLQLPRGARAAVWPCGTRRAPSCASRWRTTAGPATRSGGYELVYTPHLSKEKLFEQSGHLGFYADGMYPPMEMDNGDYYIEADELPDAPAHLQEPPALATGSSPCGSSSWAPCTATSGPAPCTASCGSAGSRRTTPTSSARPTRRPGRSAASCSSSCRCSGRSASRTSRPTSRPDRPRSPWAPRRAGRRPRPRSRRRWWPRGSRSRSTRAAAPSTGRRST